MSDNVIFLPCETVVEFKSDQGDITFFDMAGDEKYIQVMELLRDYRHLPAMTDLDEDEQLCAYADRIMEVFEDG